jgi:hypothetical protein
MRTLTRFIAACIRSQALPAGGCKLPLTGQQTKIARSLLERLRQSGGEATEELQRDLQSLLFACATDPDAQVHGETFSCPIQCFIAASSYNEDDTFKPPAGMTTILAQWQFLLRATALCEAKESPSGGDSGTMFLCGTFICPMVHSPSSTLSLGGFRGTAVNS